jgi:hypothetical protein
MRIAHQRSSSRDSRSHAVNGSDMSCAADVVALSCLNARDALAHRAAVEDRSPHAHVAWRADELPLHAANSPGVMPLPFT